MSKVKLDIYIPGWAMIDKKEYIFTLDGIDSNTTILGVKQLIHEYVVENLGGARLAKDLGRKIGIIKESVQVLKERVEEGKELKERVEEGKELKERVEEGKESDDPYNMYFIYASPDIAGAVRQLPNRSSDADLPHLLLYQGMNLNTPISGAMADPAEAKLWIVIEDKDDLYYPFKFNRNKSGGGRRSRRKKSRHRKSKRKKSKRKKKTRRKRK